MLKFGPVTLATLAVLSSQSVLAALPDEVRLTEPQANVPTIPPVIVAPGTEEADVVVQTSGAHFFKRVLTSTKPQTTRSETFVDLPGAKTTIFVPPGMDVLVNVSFSAESRCNEPNSTAQNWCEASILVDGAEALPAASSFSPDTYAFDSTDGGSEGVSSWESHSMNRHRCIFNRDGSTFKNVPVEVKWKVTNFDGNVAPNFWLDDWSLTVEQARGCRQTRQNF